MKIIDSFRDEHFFLSNFFEHPIRSLSDGLVYPSGEHFFQALKSDDPEVRAKIAAAPTPNAAKYLGRSVDLVPYWDQAHRYTAMRHVLEMKFTDLDLRLALLRTGDALLIEGNTWGDKVWGVDVKTGQGMNILGSQLMDLRKSLRGAMSFPR